MLLASQLKNTTILHLFILYFITNLFFLLNFQGVYWDDWVIVSQQPETIINIFSQTGLIWIGYLHVFLQKVGNGIYIYRIVSFFAYFLSVNFSIVVARSRTDLFYSTHHILIKK